MSDSSGGEKPPKISPLGMDTSTAAKMEMLEESPRTTPRCNVRGSNDGLISQGSTGRPPLLAEGLEIDTQALAKCMVLRQAMERQVEETARQQTEAAEAAAAMTVALAEAEAELKAVAAKRAEAEARADAACTPAEHDNKKPDAPDTEVLTAVTGWSDTIPESLAKPVWIGHTSDLRQSENAAGSPSPISSPLTTSMETENDIDAGGAAEQQQPSQAVQTPCPGLTTDMMTELAMREYTMFPDTKVAEHDSDWTLTPEWGHHDGYFSISLYTVHLLGWEGDDNLAIEQFFNCLLGPVVQDVMRVFINGTATMDDTWQVCFQSKTCPERLVDVRKLNTEGHGTLYLHHLKTDIRKPCFKCLRILHTERGCKGEHTEQLRSKYARTVIGFVPAPVGLQRYNGAQGSLADFLAAVENAGTSSKESNDSSDTSQGLHLDGENVAAPRPSPSGYVAPELQETAQSKTVAAMCSTMHSQSAKSQNGPNPVRTEGFVTHLSKNAKRNLRRAKRNAAQGAEKATAASATERHEQTAQARSLLRKQQARECAIGLREVQGPTKST
ncbi:hypothetical protein BBJ28_00017832 [Nothophytophthora sp. Chile5]|nr:hypothetical protein BBJ28_00017832 [Nothophytophthora sp. Chile5]